MPKFNLLIISSCHGDHSLHLNSLLSGDILMKRINLPLSLSLPNGWIKIKSSHLDTKICHGACQFSQKVSSNFHSNMKGILEGKKKNYTN